MISRKNQKLESGNGSEISRFSIYFHDAINAQKVFLTSFDFPEKSEVQKLESGNGSEIFTYMML